jgi:hypothetical protein
VCTVSIIPLPAPRSGYRVVFNRDEQRSREPGLPPRWHATPAGAGAVPGRALWPTDGAAGGTWIAASERGVVLALMNLNLEPAPDLTGADPVSRGMLIPRLVGLAGAGADAVAAALRERRLERFAPFRLLVVEPGAGAAGPRISECVWDLERLSVRRHGAAAVCLASSGLGDSRVLPRLALFRRCVECAGRGPTPAAQDRFHRHAWERRPEISVLMSRPDARTVSITTVEVARRWIGAGSAGEDAFDVTMAYERVAEEPAAGERGDGRGRAPHRSTLLGR